MKSKTEEVITDLGLLKNHQLSGYSRELICGAAIDELKRLSSLMGDGPEPPLSGQTPGCGRRWGERRKYVRGDRMYSHRHPERRKGGGDRRDVGAMPIPAYLARFARRKGPVDRRILGNEHRKKQGPKDRRQGYAYFKDRRVVSIHP